MVCNLPPDHFEYHFADRFLTVRLVADCEIPPDVGEALGHTAQQPRTKTVDRPYGDLFRRFPGNLGDPLGHLLAGAVGEGQAEDFRRFGRPRDQQVCDPMRQGIGLAGTGPRQKQEVVRQVFHSELLLFVEGDGGWHGGTSLAFDRNGQGRFLFDLG